MVFRVSYLACGLEFSATIFALPLNSSAPGKRSHACRHDAGWLMSSCPAAARSRRGTVRFLIMKERVNAGRDLRRKTRAVEDAKMAHLRLHVMHPHRARDLAAEPVRRLGLAHPRNVVLLALDGHQGDAPDLGEIHFPAAIGHPASGEGMAYEHCVEGLEVELGREIHDGEVF